MSARVMLKSAAIAGLTLLLGGCSYDYLQRTDRVAYSAGDAVRANLERETINPTKRSMYVTKGLGRNGSLNPASSVTLPASVAAVSTD